MSYNPTAIRSAIKTLLSTVTGIANVYDKDVADIEGYPAIIFDLTNDVGDFLDDITNIHELTYTAEIYVETPVNGQGSAVTAIDTAVKNVIEALELKSNASLSGVVDWVIPTSGRSQQIQTTQGVVYMKEVIIRCKVSSTIV